MRLQRVTTKVPKLWVFWYANERNGERFVLGWIECKQPEKSKIRKEQKRLFHKVAETGYTNDSFDFDFLTWPQSKINTQ